MERNHLVRGGCGPWCGGASLFRHPARDSSPPHGVVESKRWVDFFNPESQSVEWATPWSRTAENFANATGDQGYPVGKSFDPLCFAGTLKEGVYIPDAEKLERLKLAEIKDARIAMLAMLIFYFEARQGKTPLGALGL